MATRSKTVLFLQYRNSYARPAGGLYPRAGGSAGLGGGASIKHAGYEMSESAGLIANEGSAGGYAQLPPSGGAAGGASGMTAVDMSHLPPRWLQVIDDIDRAVAEMRGQVSELEVLHRRHLMAGFDDAGSEGQIHALTGAITTSLQAAQRRVKRVLPDGAPLPSDPAQATAQARALSKNVQMSLAAKLQDVSTTFRKAQSAYLGKLRARETRGKDVFSGAAAGMAEISPEDAELDAVFTDAQMRLVQDNEEVVSQREREINAIVKSIHDLAAIFQELQTMVIDQGTVLDRIDYNIENTQVHLESAHSELVKAQSYQNNWPAKICIGLLIVVCALIFIAVIVKKSRYTAPANNGNVTTIIIGTEDTASGL